MEINSISDLERFSLFIFDLDNTIYDEKDYLFQGYRAIAARIASIHPVLAEDCLFADLKNLFRKEGRDRVFDKFLERHGLDNALVTDCLETLRSFTPEKPVRINRTVRKFLFSLKDKGKKIFVLTNGNTIQQRNKIRHIRWESLGSYITFIYANDIEPKPSPAGVIHILNISGTEKENAIFFGDKDTDRESARKAGIIYLDINDLKRLLDYRTDQRR
jgi:FMN phosphatase YigB (HAD superfamily)